MGEGPGERVRVAAYLPRSRANGPGLRSVLWVQGCPQRCPGCFNPAFLPCDGGRVVPVVAVADWVLAAPDTEGLSLSGGEPFAQAAPLADLAERVRAAGKGVLIFTGHTAAALRTDTDADTRRLLAAADLLVAGPYRQESPIRHPLLASANQELIFLTGRYRHAELGPRRTEFRIGADGAMTVTGFPLSPSPPDPLPLGGRGRPAAIFLPSPRGGGAGGEGRSRQQSAFMRTTR
ncbi:hypothetical protein THSYN_12420 [Candidatus Thiodictyon syntrophicum]|uniref:Radical SAM core domain-containing protein n=1 Tax=Candidatus Thiodictyon syntrophicum TaxID=1166950 RepID=A0A2K8U814_9GAMM|nr:hypothetical protein THSYN_12420 [Candidatus Thiodictyon syntrophicum]